MNGTSLGLLTTALSSYLFHQRVTLSFGSCWLMVKRLCEKKQILFLNKVKLILLKFFLESYYRVQTRGGKFKACWKLFCSSCKNFGWCQSIKILKLMWSFNFRIFFCSWEVTEVAFFLSIERKILLKLKNFQTNIFYLQTKLTVTRCDESIKLSNFHIPSSNSDEEYAFYFVERLPLLV